jgi:hypothetical protein
MLRVTLSTGRCSKHAVEENHMNTPNYESNSTCPVHSLTLNQLPAWSTDTYTQSSSGLYQVEAECEKQEALFIRAQGRQYLYSRPF